MDYAILILSIIGTIANIYQKRWCFFLWIITNAYWCIYDIAIGSYAQSIQYFVFFILAVWGIIRWQQKNKKRNKVKRHELRTANKKSKHGKRYMRISKKSK